MLVDGIDLLTGTGIRSVLTSNARGTTFPSNPTDNMEFELTATQGNNLPGIYFYSASESKWVVKTPGNDVLPYDIAGSSIGTIRAGDIIASHVTVRGFKLKAGFYGCIASAGVAPAANTSFTIGKIGRTGAESTLGSMVFNAGETQGIFVQNGSADINITAGETLFVKAPGAVDQFIANLAFTLAGSLL